MNEIILSGIKLNDLLDKISQIIRQEIENKLTITKSTQDSVYISRKETATMLKVSLPTLNDWTKRGIINSYRIRSRILYKKAEIENSVSVREFIKGRD